MCCVCVAFTGWWIKVLDQWNSGVKPGGKSKQCSKLMKLDRLTFTHGQHHFIGWQFGVSKMEKHLLCSLTVNPVSAADLLLPPVSPMTNELQAESKYRTASANCEPKQPSPPSAVPARPLVTATRKLVNLQPVTVAVSIFRSIVYIACGQINFILMIWNSEITLALMLADQNTSPEEKPLIMCMCRKMKHSVFSLGVNRSC